eukprot:37945-Rhodomonas_salina.1
MTRVGRGGGAGPARSALSVAVPGAQGGGRLRACGPLLPAALPPLPSHPPPVLCCCWFCGRCCFGRRESRGCKRARGVDPGRRGGMRAPRERRRGGGEHSDGGGEQCRGGEEDEHAHGCSDSCDACLPDRTDCGVLVKAGGETLSKRQSERQGERQRKAKDKAKDN